MTIRKEVKVKVTGGARFAAVDVEAQSVPLLRSGSSFEGKKMVTFSPDTVEVFVWIKGGTGAAFKVDLTVNAKTVAIAGAVGASGQVKRTKHIPFTDFGL